MCVVVVCNQSNKFIYISHTHTVIDQPHNKTTKRDTVNRGIFNDWVRGKFHESVRGIFRDYRGVDSENR